MRRWNVKHVLVMAAAIYVLSTTTTIVAERVVYTDGGDNYPDNFTHGELKEMETRLDYTTNAPETFSNGYRFDMGTPIHQSATGQDGNTIKSTEDFSLSYRRDGNPGVFVTVQGTGLYSEEGQPNQTFDHSGITSDYTRDQYRFVPPDYQASDEEKVKEAAGELYISYGSNRIQSKVVQSVLWEDGEKAYIIVAMDNPVTARGIAQMTGGLIDNKR